MKVLTLNPVTFKTSKNIAARLRQGVLSIFGSASWRSFSKVMKINLWLNVNLSYPRPGDFFLSVVIKIHSLPGILIDLGSDFLNDKLLYWHMLLY